MTAAAVARVRLADYDRCLPCGTPSARRRHLAHAETCETCGVEGAVVAGRRKGRAT